MLHKTVLSKLKARDLFKVRKGSKAYEAKLSHFAVYWVFVARREYGKFVEIFDFGKSTVSEREGRIVMGFINPRKVPMAIAEELTVYKFGRY